MDVYAHRRDPEYGFPSPVGKVEFATDSTCNFVEISDDNIRDRRQWTENERTLNNEDLQGRISRVNEARR
jgi:hypothetical protein